MIIEIKDKSNLLLEQLNAAHLNSLVYYLENLSELTKKRFAPHFFDKQAITAFYQKSANHWGYIAQTINTHEIVAYCIIKLGYVEGDYHRFQSYGVNPNYLTDCQFAPSVADEWQNAGVGYKLYQFILPFLKARGIKRIALWGGVQADNEKAINFYQKNDFKTLGQFWHNGNNIDMMASI